MEKCPDCDGKKGWNELTTPEWHEPPEYEWCKCWTCDGKGEISALRLAVHKARGKSMPIQFRGYA